jgi:uncharacterized protein (DUF1778 family)
MKQTKQKHTKTHRLNIRVTPAIKKMIKKKAKQDHFSNVSEWLRWLLKNYRRTIFKTRY